MNLTYNPPTSPIGKNVGRSHTLFIRGRNNIMADGEQGYIPVYSVPCDPLHRQGTFWWLCLQLLDNGSLVSAVDTVKADVVSFHKK